MKFRVLLIVAALLLLPATRVVAQNSDKDKDAKSEKPAGEVDAAATKEEVSTTDHTIRIGGQNLPYKAKASTKLLKNEKGDATGLLYLAAYTRTDVKDLSMRPISFLYNGGPGSATMWLHMGAFGHGACRQWTGNSRRRRPTSWWITRRACWTRRIWFSSMRWEQATATRFAKRKTRISTGSMRMSRRSRNSS